MHSAMLATTWELWARNRAGILVAFGAVLVMALLAMLLPAVEKRKT